MRTDEELLEIFRGAFEPLICQARVGDYGKQIHFDVLDASGKLLRQGRYPLTKIRTDLELRTHIEHARDAISAKSVVSLLPWELPALKK